MRFSRRAGVIVVHGHFPKDDLFFFDEFLRRNGGVLHAIGENIDGGLPVFGRDVDMENGLLEGSVRVHRTAVTLDFMGDLRNTPRVAVPLNSICSRTWEMPEPGPLAFGDVARPGTRPGHSRRGRCGLRARAR